MLVTFELLEVEQSYIPLLKALMCGINAAGAQRCGCMFTFCHAYLKMGVLLHKMAIVCNQKFMAVVIARARSGIWGAAAPRPLKLQRPISPFWKPLPLTILGLEAQKPGSNFRVRHALLKKCYFT